MSYLLFSFFELTTLCHSYLLGITCQAYAEALKSSVESQELTDEYLDKSIYYLKLRIFSEYDDDFIEQRWSSMILLGSIYTNYKKDFTNAELWFSLCRDYNNKQCECSMALCRLYVAHGSLDMAFNEMEKVLRTEREDRLMLNWFKTWDCDVPQLAFVIFSHYLRIYSNVATPQDAMYMLLLRSYLDNPQCAFADADRTLTNESKMQVNKMLNQIQKGKLIHADSSVADLCAHEHMQIYLVTKGYQFHPCQDTKVLLADAQECGDFHYVLPPPVEEYQAREKKEFIGSASLLDIVHHVYAGR